MVPGSCGNGVRFCRTWLILFSVLISVHGIQAQGLINKGIDLEGFSKAYSSLPMIDLDSHTSRQVIVDREPGIYLGHPTTYLREDGRTMFVVYPKGHGKGSIVLKRSDDGGLTWSERLPVPESWQSSLEVPTLYPAEDAAGNQRVLMFSGLYPARMAVSGDAGETWSELHPIGDWGGIVVMGDVIPLNTGRGHYLAMFHDDGRFFTHKGRDWEEIAQAKGNFARFTLYKTFSFDGGLTWRMPEPVFSSRIMHLCEPGMVRSPDGKQIAVLLRENARRMNAHILFSDDEGKTWSTPRQLPNALTGDRHQAVYLPDGRLFISFRDHPPALARYRQLLAECRNCDEDMLRRQAGPVSPTAGDWVGWVGTYQDLVEGNEGQYLVRLKDNTNGTDCAYPAIEVLPDGTVVATTYGHWEQGEMPFILSVRFRAEELDAMARQK